MNESPDITRAWTVGFFDGEGCINIQRAFLGGKITPRFILEARVSSTSWQSLELLQKNFSGRIYRLREGKKEWATCFQWYIYGNRAAQFLHCICPYLVIKKEQAQLALEFHDSCHTYTNTKLHRGPRAMPPVELQRREELRNKILSYNAGKKQRSSSDASLL